MRIAGVLVFVALLAGCGGTAASLEDAADATAAETSRFEMSYRVKGASVKSSFAMEAAGVFDYPNERGIMTVSGDISPFGGDIALREFRLMGPTGYIHWIVKGKPYWVKEDDVATSGDPAELLIPFPGSPTKPTDVLTRALLASEENETVGHEDVRGTATTHYRARVDLRKVVNQLPAAERPKGNAEHFWGARFVPVEIWIDDENRLRRIRIEQAENGDSEAITTVELFDYGVEVKVEPPPADELISQEEFDKLTASSLELEPKESAKARPMSLDEVCESAREHLPKKEADRMCQEVKESQ
jgi:hypothetical protein